MQSSAENEVPDSSVEGSTHARHSTTGLQNLAEAESKEAKALLLRLHDAGFTEPGRAWSDMVWAGMVLEATA